MKNKDAGIDNDSVTGVSIKENFRRRQWHFNAQYLCLCSRQCRNGIHLQPPPSVLAGMSHGEQLVFTKLVEFASLALWVAQNLKNLDVSFQHWRIHGPYREPSPLPLYPLPMITGVYAENTNDVAMPASAH